MIYDVKIRSFNAYVPAANSVSFQFHRGSINLNNLDIPIRNTKLFLINFIAALSI